MNISSALKPSQRWSMTARRRPINPTAPAPSSKKTGSLSFTTRLSRRRPPTSVQLFAPFRRPNPEIVLFASYLPDRVGLIRSMRENGLNTKVCCAMTTGAQSASIKTSVATPHPPQESASQPPDVVDYERTAGLEQLIGARRANIARRQ